MAHGDEISNRRYMSQSFVIQMHSVFCNIETACSYLILNRLKGGKSCLDILGISSFVVANRLRLSDRSLRACDMRGNCQMFIT